MPAQETEAKCMFVMLSVLKIVGRVSFVAVAGRAITLHQAVDIFFNFGLARFQ